jgi:hypothetical protein
MRDSWLGTTWNRLWLRRSLTHVVPLGLSCRVTYQARVFFGSEVAFPFDWMLTPLEGLARYLAVLDPDRIYSEAALEEVVVDGRVTALQSREFGLLPYHEFPRHREGDVSVVSPGWQEHLAAAKERHARRLQRLEGLDAAGHRILFIRHKFDVDLGKRDAQRPVEVLWNTLRRRWKRADIRLLLINMPAVDPPSRRVLQLSFEDLPGPEPEAWRGDSERWAGALASLGLTLQGRTKGSPPVATPGPPN